MYTSWSAGQKNGPEPLLALPHCVCTCPEKKTVSVRTYRAPRVCCQKFWMELISATTAHSSDELASAPLLHSRASWVLSADWPWPMLPNPPTPEPPPVPPPPPSTLMSTTTSSPTKPRPPPPTARPRPPNPPPPLPRMSVMSDVSRSAPSLNLMGAGFPVRGPGNRARASRPAPAAPAAGAERAAGDLPAQRRGGRAREGLERRRAEHGA